MESIRSLMNVSNLEVAIFASYGVPKEFNADFFLLCFTLLTAQVLQTLCIL